MMETSANFIPLGVPPSQRFFGEEKPKREKIIGATPEERKKIAADIRKAAKKEKKLIKADAKRQRKQNAVMHRRMTKNPEKYTKNKERNRIRAIEAERSKIRNQAVRQAQLLAAKHDPSGKMFNVGEVVILEDGSVKSKETLAAVERRKAEKAAEDEAKRQPDPQEEPKKGNLSKRQQKRQAALQPRPPPPRPVIPEGISMPEGEEDFVAMWDITDEQIQVRLSNEKRKKSIGRKNLRREQKAAKRINKAMKILKRQTENLGQKWDAIEGRKIVMKRLEGEPEEADSQDSKDGADSAEDDYQDDEEVPDIQEPSEPALTKDESHQFTKSVELKKPDNPESSSNGVAGSLVPAKKSEAKVNGLKRPAVDETAEEPKSKKSKKSQKSQKSHQSGHGSSQAVEPTEIPTAVEHLSDAPSTSGVEAEVKKLSKVEKRALKEEKRIKKEQKRAKKAMKEDAKSTTAIEENGVWKYQKRKHEDDTEPEKAHKKKRNNGAAGPSALSSSMDAQNIVKEILPGASSGTAAQWNPDALTGEAARKDKFLRLLGAGKASAALSKDSKHKSNAKAGDILRVESDLERQYEAGMRMKHDGGGKRKGLGA